MCWLFVYCLFLLIPPPLWIQSLSHPLICLRHPSFVHAFSLCAHACAQTQADGPSVRQDEPCHEPQTDIMLTLRPSSNHLSPACCATPLDSKLRHTFAIPSRTVFCQHWATFFPHSEASSPRRLRVAYSTDTFTIDSSAVGAHVRFYCWEGIRRRTMIRKERHYWCYVRKAWDLQSIVRNAVINSVFNTDL